MQNNIKNIVLFLIGCLIILTIIIIIPKTDNLQYTQSTQETLESIEYETRIHTTVAINNKINEDNKYMPPKQKQNNDNDNQTITKTLNIGQCIVNYAYQFVGWLPYVWGGSSLEYGADCCGFTRAIYRDFGIEIPGTVEQQILCGYSVSLQEIRPGDLVFYYGHVALYAGDETIIHAPSPGRCISTESIYMQHIVDIRRIIEN